MIFKVGEVVELVNMLNTNMHEYNGMLVEITEGCHIRQMTDPRTQKEDLYDAYEIQYEPGSRAYIIADYVAMARDANTPSRWNPLIWRPSVVGRTNARVAYERKKKGL